MKDGFSDDNIYCLAVDGNNAVWAGTKNGLNRFDGKECKVYTTNDGLPDNYIRTLAVDAGGAVWCATKTFICKFDGAKWTTLNLIDKIPQESKK